MRVWPSEMRCSVARRAPRRLSVSTLADPAGPVCGSIDTTGTAVSGGRTVGVTTMAPSMSVPPSRDSERLSHPW